MCRSLHYSRNFQRNTTYTGIFKNNAGAYILQRTVKVGMIRILIREKEELRHERIEPDRKEKAMSMDKIVHDSLHYFEENGYYNTSIEMLCEKAMISRTTFLIILETRRS